jgi:hypothetical protein
LCETDFFHVSLAKLGKNHKNSSYRFSWSLSMDLWQFFALNRAQLQNTSTHNRAQLSECYDEVVAFLQPPTLSKQREASDLTHEVPKQPYNEAIGRYRKAMTAS